MADKCLILNFLRTQITLSNKILYSHITYIENMYINYTWYYLNLERQRNGECELMLHNILKERYPVRWFSNGSNWGKISL